MQRRTFLQATMTTALLAAERAALAADLPSFDPAGLTKATIATPALVVELDALEANIRKMAAHCQQAQCGFRPHAKTHKCPAIARRQLEAGAAGISVATLPEAEAMAAAGIRGLLLTSPIVDPRKIARIESLVRGGADLMIAVGSERQARLLADAAEANGKTQFNVLVDLDVGDRRTGVLPGEQAVALARIIGRLSPRLNIRGVQAYAGHASHTVGFEARQRVSREAMTKAAETRRLLQQAGFEAAILSGGSTGTYNIDSAIDGVTELQVGSYVFMDVDYRRIGSHDGQAVYADFQPSLTVLTTVISATHQGRVTVDAGTKAIDTTTANRPEAKSRPGILYTRAGDEFGALTSETGEKLPQLGERIEFIVPHCDPNVNLYDRLYACRGDKVEAIWPIAGRRGEG
jgi:D-serine deaminase-like pyridoxal phosphate-dependent protein